MSKTGRKPRVSDEEILRVFRKADAPVLTASEVADELPISHSAVNPRLRDLADSGRLSRKNVGSRAVVWWVDNANESESDAPAAPLKQLVGMLSEDEADRAEERSQEWREEFNREIMGDEESA
jgi:DNA-binding Lrp family transcriptional regulator